MVSAFGSSWIELTRESELDQWTKIERGCVFAKMFHNAVSDRPHGVESAPEKRRDRNSNPAVKSDANLNSRAGVVRRLGVVVRVVGSFETGAKISNASLSFRAPRPRPGELSASVRRAS